MTMTVTPAPLPLPDLSPYGGGIWQSYPRESAGTTFLVYRAVLTDPAYTFFTAPDEVCSVCTTDCDFSIMDACELCDNHICHECGLAYHGCDLNC
jgi:hypothetical protein